MTPKPTLLMLPPQTVTTRAWAGRLGDAVPELSIVVAEDDDAALKEIAGADAAFGTSRPISSPGGGCGGCRRRRPPAAASIPRR
jgi:hypothetical protein